jgi:glycosyltransferase involved in cell wall biosynthesis
MVKILSIVPYKIFPAKVGGQKGIALFNEYLAKEVELVCITVKSNDAAYANGYQILNLLSDSFLRYVNPFYIFPIRKLINSHKPSHLLLEHPYYGWLGVILRKTSHVKLIIHSHNIESTRWRSLGKWWWKILWWYERFTHRQADFNFFIQDNDRAFAIREFGLSPTKCITVTYGIERQTAPSPVEIEEARKTVRVRHAMTSDETVLLFNGAFNYLPNLQALKTIISEISPRLKQEGFHFKIIICGRDIPAEISSIQDPHIIFAGFVDDVSEYFKAADIFINPVTEGGGIKTKLVEALAYNLNAVSTKTGAIGVDPSLCNNKLQLTADDDWQAFTEGIIYANEIKANIPAAYFQHFYWGYSIKKAVAFIKQ